MHTRKVLIVNQHFYPDVAATGQLLEDLAIDLVKAGYQVKVICSSTGYAEKERFPSKELYQGIEIRRTFAMGFSRRGVLSKISRGLSYFTFMFGALYQGLKSNYDVILTTTSPPLGGLLGAIINKFKKGYFLYQVYDVYPDVALAVGAISQGILHSLWRKIENFTLSQADRIIVLGEHMKHVVNKHVPGTDKKTVVIPPWVDSNNIVPLRKAEKNRARKKWGFEDDEFIILYSGNAGMVHQFDPVVEAAKKLSSGYPKIKFVFFGGGARLEEIKSRTKAFKLMNITFLPYQEKDNLSYSIGIADLTLVSLREEANGLVLPSKFFGYLAAKKPVLCLCGGKNELKDYIRRWDCGSLVALGDSDLLVETILHYYHDRKILECKSEKAYQAFINHFDRHIATARYIKLLKRVDKLD